MPRVCSALLGSAAALMGAHAEHGMLRGDSSSGPSAPTIHNLNSLGPLKNLIGTWEGRLGLNLVRLPNVTSFPAFFGLGNKTASFVDVVQEYMDTITFTPILGIVLNRGYQGANHWDPPDMLNQTLLGVTYHQRVHELTPDGALGQLLHDEAGQWLLQAAPGINDQWSVARLAVIPHGLTVNAVGTTQKLQSGVEVLEAMNRSRASYASLPLNTGSAPFLGYGVLFGNAGDPVLKLQQDIGPDLDSMEAVELSVTTTGGAGSISMFRNVEAQVFNEAFNATFWIETVRDYSGAEQYQQLQYAQSQLMDFQAKFRTPACESEVAGHILACRIKWPHIQVNTLRKTQAREF